MTQLITDAKNNKTQVEEIYLIFKTKNIQKLLQIFQTILEKKSLIPIFSNLKITIIKNIAYFSGMNIDLAAICEMEILNLLEENQDNNENASSIDFLVNGHLFYDVLKRISVDEITIKKQFENNFIEIIAGNFFCKMSLQNNEKFPSIDVLNNCVEYGILADVLSDSIEKVLSCSAVNDSRTFLCAIKIVQNEDNSVEFVSTDGHRLAYLKFEEKRFEVKLNNEQNHNFSLLDLILPRKTALFILKLLKENAGQKIFFRLSNQKIVFLFEDQKESSMKIKIISKISEANYPNYKRFLNQKFRLKIGVNFKKLIDGIDRALIFLDEKNSKILNFELDIISKKIILTAQSDDKGMIHEIIEDVEFMYEDNIESNKNNLDKIIININAYYLYEILRSIRSEKIIFGINDSMSPIAFSDKNFQEKFYLLMPMSK